MNLKDYGFTPEMMPENAKGTPARVTAVHKVFRAKIPDRYPPGKQLRRILTMYLSCSP